MENTLFQCLIFITVSKATVTEIPGLNGTFNQYVGRYTPHWADLDTRPLPRWYDEAKVGIFLHWGVYSVPGFRSEWFWTYWHRGKIHYRQFMSKIYPPGFTYQEFAPMFKAEFFDPDDWAKLFVKSGAKYIVLTSKHHDGYTLFPSKKSFSWNSVDVGPKRDLVGDLSHAVRKHGLKFGVYYSLFEWFNPIYRNDRKYNRHIKKNTFTEAMAKKLWPDLKFTKNYVTEKMLPDLKQLVHDYKPSVIWADGHWEASETYWESKSFLTWLYNESPVKDEVVVNDRWGQGIPGKHGDFYNFADRYNNRILQGHKWENAFTVDSTTWGYRRNIDISEVLSTSNILTQLVTTVSCGGNVLINVGPTKEGTIAPIFQDRLLSLGKWLGINGEAIYKSSPWLSQNDTSNGNVWYTCTKSQYNAQQPTAVPGPNDEVTAIYAITLEWPKGNVLKLKDVYPYLNRGNYQVKMLGNESTYLNWTILDGITQIQFPDKSTVMSEYAWTLKFNVK